jgi:glycosyltransferase involved in cell wall biosynthesis
VYRRFAMLLYFPDHLFLWGWFAAVTSLWLHLFRRYDIVYTTSYPESAHIPGLALSLAGVPWVADYRYGGPLWVRELAGFRKSMRRGRMDRRYQRSVLARATAVVTQSEPIRADFCRIFALDRDRVRVIPSGYDESDFDDRAASPPFPVNDREVHLLHSGTMEGVSPDERQEIVDALNGLGDALRKANRELVVHAVGSDLFGEERRLQAFRFEYRHHGVIVHHQLPAYLLAADCFLLSTTALVSGFIPSKLWEYLRAGAPILLAGPKDDVWTIVERAGVGLHLGVNGHGAGSGERLAHALMARIGTRGPLHPSVTDYSWESRARSFQGLFEGLIDRSRAAQSIGEDLA